MLTCFALFALPAQASTHVISAGESITPAPSAIISRDVEARMGDTLVSIAQRELGRTGFAPQLAEFNSLVVNAPLTAGDIIRIPIHVPARGEFAQVVFSKGSVFATRANDDTFRVELQRDSEVASGDTISTGDNSYISIEFSSGSVINLQPGTEATLSRLNCLPGDDSCIIEIRTLKGQVTSDVESRDQQPVDFRISTPYASAAVRGTVFDIEASSGALLVGVTEGDVDVSALDQDLSLNLGYGSVLKAGELPGDPIQLLPAPVFKRVPARLAPGDTIAWWSFTDADRYIAHVSTDNDGIQALTSFGVTDDRVGLDSVDAGDYFLQVRAVDSNGLRGFTSNTRITVASIDNDIEPVATTVTKQGSEFLVTVQDPPVEANGYEIQISGNEQFDDPLSVDVNSKGAAIFRIEGDRVFSRARVLVDPFTVSAYGPAASSD